MAEIAELLQQMVERRASDLHLKAGSAPFLRINGRLQPMELPPLNAAESEDLVRGILPGSRAQDLADSGETDFAFGVSGLGRFRVSVMRQRSSIGIVFRRVPTTPPTFDALGLPPAVRQLAERRHGLVLVTGPGDSGKSTTIATMINHVNEHSPLSVITIEDPIEILHADKKAFISQREVGFDTKDHLTGFQRSLRHDPDVLYIDRIDNADVMYAVLAASSGRLILSTLPSLSAVDTIQRVVDFFPPHHARQTRHTLASVLQGTITQRLIDREDGRGRVAAFEVLVATPRTHDAMVETPGSQPLENLIETGDYYGMQTMDQHLAELHRNKLITVRDALAAAVHPQELRVKLQQPPAP